MKATDLSLLQTYTFTDPCLLKKKSESQICHNTGQQRHFPFVITVQEHVSAGIRVARYDKWMLCSSASAGHIYIHLRSDREMLRDSSPFLSPLIQPQPIPGSQEHKPRLLSHCLSHSLCALGFHSYQSGLLDNISHYCCSPWS